MTVKSLKILLAATAFGVGAIACFGSAEAGPKRLDRDAVVASDYDVAPRHHARRHRHADCGAVASACDFGPRPCRDDCFFATEYVEPGYDPPPNFQSPAFSPTGYKYGFHYPEEYYPAPLVYAPPVLSAPSGGFFGW